MNTRMQWHTLEDVKKEDRREALIAVGLTSWGNCYMETPPAYFGEMMVVIGEKLGVSATEKNLHKLADEVLGKVQS